MKSFDVEAIRSRIEALAVAEFDAASQEGARQIGFHLTDWLTELERFVAFCQAPSSFTDGEASERITAFLLHAPAHLAAASMLALGEPVADVFNLGAVLASPEGGR